MSVSMLELAARLGVPVETVVYQAVHRGCWSEDLELDDGWAATIEQALRSAHDHVFHGRSAMVDVPAELADARVAGVLLDEPDGAAADMLAASADLSCEAALAAAARLEADGLAYWVDGRLRFYPHHAARLAVRAGRAA